MQRGAWRRFGDLSIVVLAVVVLGLAGWVVTRPTDPPVSRAEVVAPPAVSASAPASPAPTPSRQPRVLAVVGDGSAVDPGWPTALTETAGLELGADTAAAGAGYLAVDSDANTFAEQVASLATVAPAPDVVIVSGSVSDAGASGAEVRDAAAEVIEALRTELPQADVVVVGPAWAPGNAPAGEPNDARQGVKAAAREAGVAYVDPQAGTPWLAASGAVDVAGELTDAGRAIVVERMVQVLRERGLVGG